MFHINIYVCLAFDGRWKPRYTRRGGTKIEERDNESTWRLEWEHPLRRCLWDNRTRVWQHPPRGPWQCNALEVWEIRWDSPGWFHSLILSFIDSFPWGSLVMRGDFSSNFKNDRASYENRYRSLQCHLILISDIRSEKYTFLQDT